MHACICMYVACLLRTYIRTYLLAHDLHALYGITAAACICVSSFSAYTVCTCVKE